MPLLKVGPSASALDLPEFERGGASEALNVIPRADSYSPLPGPAELGGAMTARVQGAVVGRGVGGTLAQFAGDATKLYRLSADGTTWNDVSRISGGPYATPATGGWSFCQVDDDILADNGFDAAQKFTIASSTNFADLGGSPPVASYIVRAREFAMKLRVANFGNRAQWSGFNQKEVWTPSQASQSDFKDLDGGDGMALVGGEYAVALMEHAIYRATYVNLPRIWQWDKIAQGIGTPFSRATSYWENLVFFISEDGFQMLIGGQEIRPIGRNRWDKFFFNDLDHANLHRVTSSIDPLNRLVAWSYPSKFATNGTPDKGLIYNWQDNRWSRFETVLEMLHTALSQMGFTLDQLDPFGTLDALPFSLDDPFWIGAGRPSLAGFSTAHKLALFTGQYMAATVDTTEAHLFPGYRAKARSVRPMIEGSATPTIRIGTRNRLTDDVTFGAASTMNSYGTCPVQENARYMRARIQTAAGGNWRHILGIDDVEASRAGKR